MAKVVKTLAEAIRDARLTRSMYQDLIRNGARREDEITAEIEALSEKRDAMKRSRMRAPDALVRAEATLRRLELQAAQNQAVGYEGPSKATLQRKADRELNLRLQVAAMAEKLREMGMDPSEVLKMEVD